MKLFSNLSASRTDLKVSIPKKLWDKAYSLTEEQAEERFGEKYWDVFDGATCNSGACDLFARNLFKFVPGIIMYGTMYSGGADTVGHIWVYYKGKYYDAEIPNGVRDINDVPYVKNAIRIKNNYILRKTGGDKSQLVTELDDITEMKSEKDLDKFYGMS